MMAPIRDILYWQERTRKAEERGDRLEDENAKLRKQIHDTATRLAKVAAAVAATENRNEALDAALAIATVASA